MIEKWHLIAILEIIVTIAYCSKAFFLYYSPEEVRDIAAQMLGQQLITKQTGPQGKPVSKVYEY